MESSEYTLQQAIVTAILGVESLQLGLGLGLGLEVTSILGMESLSQNSCAGAWLWQATRIDSLPVFLAMLVSIW